MDLMCCQRSTSSSSTVIALAGAVATMAAASAVASVIATAASVVVAVVSFVVTVVVTVAATTSIAAGLYLTARLVTAFVMARAEAPVVESLPEIGPGAVAALPIGDIAPLTIPTISAVEVPR